MVFIAEYNKRVYYTRDKTNFEVALKTKKGVTFKCLNCRDTLQFVNGYERTHNVGFKQTTVTAHFRHMSSNPCEYENNIDTYLGNHSGLFHKMWTFDLIKSEFLFRYWYNLHICDIKTPNGTFVFVRDAHQTQHCINEKEMYSSSKPLWILNGEKRPFNLHRYNKTLYITFVGKTDIPFFSENHSVFLDTNTDKLVEIHLNTPPHSIYGYVATLVDYNVFLEKIFNGCILPSASYDRPYFDIRIRDIATIDQSNILNNDFISYYTIVNAKTWFLRQANKTMKLSTTAVPTKFKILNGMKTEYLNDSRFVYMSLPTCQEAFDTLSDDVQQTYKSMLDDVTLDMECYAHFCAKMKLLIDENHSFQASLKEYQRKYTLGQDYEDVETTILKRYQQIEKSVEQLNIYNQVLLAFKAKKLTRYQTIDKNVLFNLCRFVEDVDKFIDNPFSLHVRYWYLDEQFITLEHIAISNKMCKSYIITALIQRYLYRVLLNGETCTTRDEVIKGVFEMTSITEGITTCEIAMVLKSQQGMYFETYTINSDIKGTLPMVFLKDIFDKEYNIAKIIYQSVHSQNTLKNYSFDQVECFIKKYETLQRREIKEFEKLNKQQKDAVHSVIQNNFTLMTGYPGTGKSDVVKCLCYILINLYKFDKDDIALCAPTGKASVKLRYDNVEPTTIHKLIKYKPTNFDGDDDWEYQYDVEDNREKDIRKTHLAKKIVVVDEVSMLDYNICDQLLNKINVQTTKIFFIGDRHQLPSVDYGQFLHCLVKSGVIKNHVRLRKIYRYGETMRQLALDVKNGLLPNMSDAKTVKWHKISSDDVVLQSVLAMYNKYQNNTKTKNESDDFFKVIIPTKSKTNMNSNKCNKYCHNQIYGSGIIPYVNGELVMCNKNIDKLMNGEFVYVVEVKEEDCIVVKGNNFVEYNERIMLEKKIQELEIKDPTKDDGKLQSQIEQLQREHSRVLEQLAFQNEHPSNYKKIRVPLKNLEHCYAITIHKSQGSEWENVLVVLTQEHSNMLNRNLLYTAITRVKKGMLHIFYDKESSVAQAVDSVFIRQTCLKYILRDLF
jgi:energy-coupling factor transporter ATP-binding protein EcfA2